MLHPHPGELVVEPLGLSVAEVARRLSVSRGALSRVLQGHAAISPELAYRLELAGVSTARYWLTLQSNYDIWRVSQLERPSVQLLQQQQATA